MLEVVPILVVAPIVIVELPGGLRGGVRALGGLTRLPVLLVDVVEVLKLSRIDRARIERFLALFLENGLNLVVD